MEHLFEFVVGSLTFLNVVIVLAFLPWIVLTKKDTTAAVAWCLIVALLPLLGGLFWLLFGLTRISRPIRLRRLHRANFGAKNPPKSHDAMQIPDDDGIGEDLAKLAKKVGAFVVSHGNHVKLFHETQLAYDELLEAIRQAKNHIHMEFFIIRHDKTGNEMIDLLAAKAQAGVQVRLLYDAVGCVWTKRELFNRLTLAGGQVRPFMNVFRLWAPFQINLRNHRKLVVIDGSLGFTGGMNIGDEYLGKVKRFGYWRDSFLRVRGPAVAALQRIFIVDWAFSSGEELKESRYDPDPSSAGAGSHSVQVIESGPDQDHKSIRETFFAAIVTAKKRVWIATPYFVPDTGLLDALRLARHRGVEVRVLWLLHFDKRVPYYAAFFYWSDMLKAGVKIYQYKKGMMHAKVMIVDDSWAMVGSANFDNRSLALSFEVGCILHENSLVEELANQFDRDVAESQLLDRAVFNNRPWPVRLEETAYRLLSPLL